MNNLYNQLNGDIVTRFNQFRQSFKGDPKAEVMRMLQSGQISQADLNRAQAMAQQLQGILRV